MPRPPPTHRVASPLLAPRRCISCTKADEDPQPEAPMGWPVAMAPPLTLTFSLSHSSS